MRKPHQKRKSAKDPERDMAIARAVAPVEVGGGGMNYAEAGKLFGIGKARVGTIVNEPDILELRKDWERDMMASRRSYGPEFLAAEKALIREHEPRVIINYSRTMGLDVGPSVDINIEKLEIQMSDEDRRLLAASPIVGRLPEGDSDAGAGTESTETEEESNQAAGSDS